MGDDVT
jgi:hypothetical protein